MSSTLLDKIGDAIAKRDSRRQAAYLALVRSLARGDKPSVDDVESTLAAAGKSLTDLSQDVDRMQRRVELAGQLVATEGLDAEESQLRERAAEATAALEAAEEAYDKTIDPIDCRLDQIRQLRERAESARLELQRSCLDPETLAAFAAAREALQARRQERLDLHNQRQRKQKALGDVRDALASFKPIHEADRKLWQAEQEALEAELAILDKAAAALDQAVAKAESAEAKTAEKLLEP